MAQQKLSPKRIKLDKTKTRILTITASAAFLVVFLLIASFTLYKQLTYQNRVIGVKKDAVRQLQSNLTARDSLVESYKGFAGSNRNLIGGAADGSGQKDGSNAKLVLDALPSKYDFPALAASLEKLLIEQKGKIQSIGGTDDEVAQSGTEGGDTAAPVEIPVELSVDASYADLRNIVTALERSIRPFQFTKLEITGDQQNLTLTLEAKTFYQPSKSLTIKSEVVQ